MKSQKAFLLFVVLFFGVIVWMRVAPPVLAAAPNNDDFGHARFLSPLTYFDIANTGQATTANDDPFDGPRGYSVWYTFTPDHRMPVEANTFDSNYDTFLAVYTGARGSLSLVASNDDYAGLQSSRVHFIGAPGTQYYFMVSSGTTGGKLHFLVKELTAPPNDNFAHATVIPKVPYPDTPVNGRSDAFASTLQPNEPIPNCSDGGTINNSVWYAYKPAANATISLALNFHPDSQVLAVYTGSKLNSLTQVTCRMFYDGDGGLLTLAVQAGITYYIQAGNPSELGDYFWLSLQNPPPPVVDFFYYPFDASIYDDINFYGDGFDPAGVGIVTWKWDFGDGTKGAGQSVIHRYAANQDYTVTMSGTTSDGRKATKKQTVSVRTHDVSITKFTTPKSGRLGKTVTMVVGIANRLAPETVRVDFLSSGPYGFQLVGTQVLYVPAQPTKTTDFTFSYTFTPQDAAVGKVNFKADAYIETGRDALPGDNEAISFPVKVTGGAAGKGNVVNEADDEGMQEDFVVRSQQSENPEIQELFLLPSYRVFLPSIGAKPQE